MIFFEKVYYQLPEAVILTDKTHSIVSLNRKAEEIFEANLGEARGKKIEDLLQCPQLFSLLEETVVLSRPPQLTYENSTLMLDVNGRKRFFKLSIIPVITFQNELELVITTMAEVTVLKEIEQLKTDFIATASHEFRTPLTSISMGISMMKTGKLGEPTPQMQKILDALEEDCDRLLRLAENLLDLSRLESGAIAMEIEEVDVYRMVEAALGTLRLQAEKRDIELQAHLPENLPRIRADLNKAIWVLTNLVANALRYTKEGGSIKVSVYQKGARLFFSVADTGKGIPREYQERIFQKYVQVKEGKKDAAGGAGLGLAIAKDIVEAHGGEIWVNSEPNKGAVFTFSIPVVRG